MRARRTIFFACILTLASSCGDPQLNESRREFFPVTLTEWHDRYAPGVTAVVPFPQLAEVSEPRFTSSDPAVAQASVFRQSVDEPRFRALRLATGATGRSNISLYDGDRLVRTEEIGVFDPYGFSFDLRIQNEVAPPEAALGPEDKVELLQTAPVPAVLRFYRESREVVAAGVPSADYPGRGMLVRTVGDGVDEPSISDDGVYGAPERLSSGEIVEITAVDRLDLWIDLPSGGSVSHEGYYLKSGKYIDGLEIIASPTRVGNRASIAVFGLSYDTRIVGLDPEVTLDGEVLDYCEHDDCTGDTPLPFGLRWRWLFPLPDGVSTGTIEARWRGLATSIELGEGQ